MDEKEIATKKKVKKKVGKGYIFAYALFGLVVLAGIGMLAYPTFSNWWNLRFASRAILGYNEYLDSMSEEELRAERMRVRAFNASVAQNATPLKYTEEQEAQYWTLLTGGSAGVMCYVELPDERITLPVYHGTGDDVLQDSIGHLEGTSLPLGGASTHVALSGHNGLTSARLFTDLEKARVGEIFYVHVLGETLAYQVFSIDKVLPEEVDLLRVMPGEDLVTLITCTPYGVNTHRLLVRGQRVYIDENGNVAKAEYGGTISTAEGASAVSRLAAFTPLAEQESLPDAEVVNSGGELPPVVVGTMAAILLVLLAIIFVSFIGKV